MFLKIPDDVVNRATERSNVLGVNRWEHGDAQLVTTKLAVRLGVDDAIGTENLGDERGVHAISEVDRANDIAALRRVLNEWRGEVGLLGPGVEDLGAACRTTGREA